MPSSSSQPRRRTSIRDVAREAGVSHSMVSLILNGKTGGSEATRKRVLEAAQALNYRPDTLFREAVTARARNERGETGKPATGIIAYILPQWMSTESTVTEGFYSMAMGGVNAAAAENGYHVLLCPMPATPAGIPSVIMDGRVDGAVINMNLPAEWMQLLANTIPCVATNRFFPNVSMRYVTANWVDVARKQMQYAWDLGHRNIAILERDDGISHLVRPYDLFLRMFTHLGGKLVHPQLSRLRTIAPEPDWIKRSAADFIDEWFALPEGTRPTIILAPDGHSAALVKIFQQRGIRVPADVSILSRYGHEISTSCEPALTTYSYPNWEIARTATRLLIDDIRTDAPHSAHYMLDGQMVIRDSCRRLTPTETKASEKLYLRPTPHEHPAPTH